MKVLFEIARYIKINLGLATIPKDAPESDIVVSITTLPERIHKINPTLISLLAQKTQPKKILVWVPKYSIREEKVYPILNLPLDNSKIQIMRIEEDLGPITKLIPALRRYKDNPDQKIICLDDDIIYSKYLIDDFIKAEKNYPDATLAMIGYNIPVSLLDKDRFKQKVYANRVHDPNRVDVVTGYGGFMIKPLFFGPEFVSHLDQPKESFFTDDLWISGHLSRMNIKRLVVPSSSKFSHLKRLNSWSAHSLSNSANKDGKNNEFTMKFFENDW